MNKRVAHGLICGFVMCLIGLSNASDASDPGFIVLSLTKSTGPVVMIDGNPVPGSVLSALSKADKNLSCVLLIEEGSTISVVENLKGLAGKAGFTSPRIFFHDKDRQWMEEVTFSKPYVYSQDVKILRLLHPQAPLDKAQRQH